MRVMARPDVRPHRPAIDGRMPRIRLEIANVLRRHGDAYRRLHAGHLGRVERRVMSAIVACRTEALGGHVEACDDCGMTRIAYNSCRNRHCPKCQGKARAAWLAAREADLLPVPYFHVVFTLPAPIAAIAFQNKAIVSMEPMLPDERQDLEEDDYAGDKRRNLQLEARAHIEVQRMIDRGGATAP